MGDLFSLFRSPEEANHSVTKTEAHHRAERARGEAEKIASEARALAEKIKQEAEAERERARARQEAVDKACAFAAEQAERLRAQLEGAKEAARRAQELAEAAAKLAQRAQEERERAELRWSAWLLQQQYERLLLRGPSEPLPAAALPQQLSGPSLPLRWQLLQSVQRPLASLNEEAERRLKKGIQPVVMPTPEELAAAKERVQYKENHFHLAITGISGSGKSSLINAFRGLRSKDTGAAAVGVTKTTLQMTRYPEPNPRKPFTWYEIQGASTLKCPDWQYFNAQGLYVFDCIIVLFDNRFTMTDIAILGNCRRFNIPTYIVCSKADQRIQNLMRDMGYESEGSDEEAVECWNRLYETARKQFIERTRKSVKANLEDANLPDQRVYIISNSTLLGIVREKKPKKTIDELELCNDLYNHAHARRSASSHLGAGNRNHADGVLV